MLPLLVDPAATSAAQNSPPSRTGWRPTSQIQTQQRKQTQPHLFMLIVDDLGFGNVGWNREVKTPEVRTPTMDQLVATGIQLERFYVFSCCSPSRASVAMGGRVIQKPLSILCADNH
jgi:hypothetical protein